MIFDKYLNTAELINDAFENSRLSYQSRAQYKKLIKYFVNYLLQINKQFDCITITELRQYRDYLLTKKLTASTVSIYFKPVKCIFNYLEIKNICTDITRILELPRFTNDLKKKVLSAQQINSLIESIPGEDTYKNKRDKLIISLMKTFGLRNIEITRLNINDIRLIDNDYYMFIQGKGYDTCEDSFILPSKLALMLIDYLPYRLNPFEKYETTDFFVWKSLEHETKFTSAEPLFVSCSNRSPRGRRITTQTISKMFKSLFKKIGICSKYYTAYSLRHSLATDVINQTGDIHKAQTVLRHQSISTTNRYLKARQKDLMRDKVFFESIMDR